MRKRRELEQPHAIGVRVKVIYVGVASVSHSAGFSFKLRTRTDPSR
jgi:hypothetical protein